MAAQKLICPHKTYLKYNVGEVGGKSWNNIFLKKHASLDWKAKQQNINYQQFFSQLALAALLIRPVAPRLRFPHNAPI